MSSSIADLTCKMILSGFYFEPHQGSAITNNEDSPMYLGAGVRGSVVRLNIAGKSINLKRYNRSSIGFLKFDRANLELLDQIPSEDLNVRAANTLSASDPRSVYIEDVLGQSFYTILMGSTELYSLKLKAQIFQRYFVFLKRVASAYDGVEGVQVKEVYVEGLNFMMSKVPVLIVESEDKSIGIVIKPDNFMVDARTLEIVIIDPS